MSPVYELFVFDPVAGVTAVLSDLLKVELPPSFPDAVSVVLLELAGERASDIHRLVDNGRVFSRDELGHLLTGAAVGSGWFFVGAPARLGDTVPAVDIPAMLRQSAFVVDVLEGRVLGVHTVSESLADAARQVIVDGGEVSRRELHEVRLLY